MKNLFKIFLAVVALFAYSCVTDTTEDLGIKISGDQTEITLSLEESRTHLGEAAEGVYPLYWSEGDKIAINGIASTALTAEQAGSPSTQFTFANGELSFPYNIVYPAPTTKLDITLGDVRAEGVQRVTFLAEQPYTVGSFAEGAAPMYGYAAEANNDAIQMHHLAGVLRFAVKGNGEAVTSITVKALGGKIAGDFNVNCTTGELTAQDSASDTVTVTFAEPLTLGAEAAYIYVAVPAGSYGVLETTIATAEHEKMVVSFDSDAKPVNVGVVREFKEFTYKATTAADEEILIVTKEDLISFAANAANTKSAKLAGVIDMTGEAWTPVQGFTGTFDGDKEGGYYIKGLTAPLFGTVSGEIKNLKLTDVNIVVTDNHVYGEKPVVYSGAIAYHIANGSLTGCYTSGKVEVNNTVFNVANDAIVGTYYDVCLGGMVGLIEGTVVSNCENHIDLTLTSCWNNENATGFSVKAGAMIGMAAVASQISLCQNYGDILCELAHTKSKAVHMAALLGGTNAAGALTVLKDCTNYGNFSVSDKASRQGDYYVGGVAGYLNAGIEELKNLTNLGCGELLGAGNAHEYRVGGVSGSLNSASDNLVNGSKDDASKGCIYICSGEPKSDNIYLAGIAYSTGGYNISNSTNYGALTIEGYANNTYLGGILASLSNGKIDKCSNYGQLNHTLATVATVNIGGILAQVFVDAESTNEKPLVVEGCNNYGPICYTAANGTTNTGNRIIGGIIGYGNAKNNLIPYTIKDCTSAGTMVFIDLSGSTKEVAYGGAFAYPQYGKDVTLTNVKVSAKMYVGSNVDLKTGVATPIPGHTEGAKFKMSGMCAMFTKHTIATNCDFSGLMQVDSQFTIGDSIHFGGYGGYGAGRYDITNSTFSGTINYSENCSHSGGFVDISGFLGYAAHSDATMVQTFTNSGVTKSGVIRVAGDVTNAKALYVGGIIATTSSKNTQVAMNGCYNLGSITLTKDVETTGGIYVGGIYSVRTSTSTSSNCTLTGCYNEGDIVVDAKSAATMCIGGICAYTNMLNATSSEAYPKFYNKGNIKVGTNLTKEEMTNYTAQLVVGGFLGLMNNNVKKNFDADFQNQGDITVKNVTTPKCNVGGIWGLHTKAPVIKSGVVLTNTGNITVEGCSLTDASTWVGGIVATTLVPINGAKCYCDLAAPNLTNVGMIMGTPRADATLATKCHVGGQIAKTLFENGDGEIVPEFLPINEGNYFNYIYGGETAWTGTDYDGCKYLSVAPTL